MPIDTDRFKGLHSEIEEHELICPKCGTALKPWTNETPDQLHSPYEFLGIPTTYCAVCDMVWFQWQEEWSER